MERLGIRMLNLLRVSGTQALTKDKVCTEKKKTTVQPGLVVLLDGRAYDFGILNTRSAHYHDKHECLAATPSHTLHNSLPLRAER